MFKVRTIMELIPKSKIHFNNPLSGLLYSNNDFLRSCHYEPVAHDHPLPKVSVRKKCNSGLGTFQITERNQIISKHTKNHSELQIQTEKAQH